MMQFLLGENKLMLIDKHIVFDLDDTLYYERDYVFSAFHYVSELMEQVYFTRNVEARLIELFEEGVGDPVSNVWQELDLPVSGKDDLVHAMRAHRPNISLPLETVKLLKLLDISNIPWSILTDGRSLTQRQKIIALGLTDAKGVYISAETGFAKPSLEAFKQIQIEHGQSLNFFYIGDNVRKDFISPNNLGWQTFMLQDQGFNIHSQNVEIGKEFNAKHSLLSILEVVKYLEI